MQKPRLHWTPELHDRFVEAVNQLGGEQNATPKGIRVLMGFDGNEGPTLAQIKSHLQKFRLGQPVGRLWKKSNVPRPTSDLIIQTSDGAGSSDVYMEGEEGEEDEIHYENNQVQVKPEEPVEMNDQGGQHHSMVATENACDTSGLMKGLEVPVPVPVAALQPTSEIGDCQTQVPTEAANDEEETDALMLPPIPRSSIEEYLKAFGESTNFFMENFPGFGFEGEARTVVDSPWNFGDTYLGWYRVE